MVEHKFEKVDKTMIVQGMPKNPTPGSGMQNQYDNQYGNFLRGDKPQTHIKVSGALRNKQAAAWQSFINDRKVSLHNEARKPTITEAAYKAEAGNLNRIRDRGGTNIGEWALDYTPNSPEFLNASKTRLNQLVEDLDASVPIRDIPQGPISGTEVETPVAVQQPLESGPIFEESVLEKFANDDGGFDFPEVDITTDEIPEADEEPEVVIDDIEEDSEASK